jgi:hypothetical protein
MKDTIVSGDLLDFVTDVPAYPPSAGYTLDYWLKPRPGSGLAAIHMAAIATPDNKYRITVGAATTAAWAAGEYSAFATVTNGPDSRTVDPEEFRDPGHNTAILVRILPDPRVITTYDGRSPARKALDDIETALSTWTATNGRVHSYTIGNRQMTFATLDEVKGERDQLRSEVWREEQRARAAAGLPSQRNAAIGFGRA